MPTPTPLPDADKVAKIEIVGTLTGQPCVNVMHAKRTAAIAPGDIAALALATKNAWVTNVIPRQTANYQLAFVRCTDLTSITGEQVSSVSGAVGGRNPPQLPNNVAVVASLISALRSRSGRGRIFLGGVSQLDMSDSRTLLGTSITAYVNAVAALATAIDAAGGAGNWQLGVLSYFSKAITPDAPHRRVVPLFSPAVTFEVKARLDSQRRRLGI